MNSKVDTYINKVKKWQEVMEQLRMILLDCELTEEWKWNKPCYTYEDSNIVVIQGFKKYCALLFMKGVLLDDPEDILVKTGPHTRVGRQIRFTDVEKIVELEEVLKKYIHNAIQVEKEGLEVDLDDEPEPIPKEFQDKMDKNTKLKKAFEALTPGRKRGYLMYFSDTKQSKTRTSRVEKKTQKILDGKRFNER